MRIVTALCAIAFLAECISTPSQAAEERDCRLQQFASVDFVFSSSEDVIFPITIADTPTQAELNLASVFSTTGPMAIDRLKLTTRSLSRLTNLNLAVGNRRITRITNPVPVSIGTYRINADFLVTTDVDGADPVTVRIGIGLFARVDLELDFANQKMNIYSQEHCPAGVVYWANSFGAVPLRKAPAGNYLVMELEGKKIETAIGTSRQITTLRADAAKSLFGIEAEGRDAERAKLGDASPPPTRQQFMEMTANGISVMNAQVELDFQPQRSTGCRLQERKGVDRAAGYVGCFNVFPLVLGMNVLRNMRLYFAMEENMLYFTAADAQK